VTEAALGGEQVGVGIARAGQALEAQQPRAQLKEGGREVTLMGCPCGAGKPRPKPASGFRQ
jgi:hypothetical protein